MSTRLARSTDDLPRPGSTDPDMTDRAMFRQLSTDSDCRYHGHHWHESTDRRNALRCCICGTWRMHGSYRP
jgi:hypothetical protein